MRNLFFAFVFIASVLVSCEEPLEKFENEPPFPFVVNTTLLNDTTARIDWIRTGDPEGDSVVYDIYFMGVQVFANLRSDNYTFSKLTRGTAYNGQVVARDAFFQERAVGFNFVTAAQDTSQ